MRTGRQRLRLCPNSPEVQTCAYLSPEIHLNRDLKLPGSPAPHYGTLPFGCLREGNCKVAISTVYAGSNARLHHRGSILDLGSHLRSTQKTVAPFEFRTGLDIEMKFISTGRNLRERGVIPTADETTGHPSAELRKLRQLGADSVHGDLGASTGAETTGHPSVELHKLRQLGADSVHGDLGASTGAESGAGCRGVSRRELCADIAGRTYLASSVSDTPPVYYPPQGRPTPPREALRASPSPRSISPPPYVIAPVRDASRPMTGSWELSAPKQSDFHAVVYSRFDIRLPLEHNVSDLSWVTAPINEHFIIVCPKSREIQSERAWLDIYAAVNGETTPAPVPTVILRGAAVAERLTCSPPTKTNRVQSPAGSPDFRKWQSCRTMPWSAGFLRVSRFPCPFLPASIFTSITLVGSQYLVIPRKPTDQRHRPARSGMRKSGVTRPGIEFGSPWWKASRLTAQPPGVVGRLLPSQQGEPGSIPRFSHVVGGFSRESDTSPLSHSGAAQYSRRFTAIGSQEPDWAGFLGDLPFTPPALLHTHINNLTSALKTSMLRAAQISSLIHQGRDVLRNVKEQDEQLSLLYMCNTWPQFPDRKERAGETGDPPENRPSNGIFRHDSHMRKSGVTQPGIEPGSPCFLLRKRLNPEPPAALTVLTAREGGIARRIVYERAPLRSGDEVWRWPWPRSLRAPRCVRVCALEPPAACRCPRSNWAYPHKETTRDWLQPLHFAARQRACPRSRKAEDTVNQLYTESHRRFRNTLEPQTKPQNMCVYRNGMTRLLLRCKRTRSVIGHTVVHPFRPSVHICVHMCRVKNTEVKEPFEPANSNPQHAADNTTQPMKECNGPGAVLHRQLLYFNLNSEVLRVDKGEARKSATSVIVRQDSHMRKSGSDPAGDRTQFVLVGGEQSNHYTTDKIDSKRVYNKVTIAIVLEFIRHALEYSAPIADLQENKKRIPYCQMWGNTGATANEQTSESVRGLSGVARTNRTAASRNIEINIADVAVVENMGSSTTTLPSLVRLVTYSLEGRSNNRKYRVARNSQSEERPASSA
ncbi:hypothetical protein PR048_030202 [Dryococelus australis]|uniref:Uncharacterized protein n=1 Tax=Dryococelus australis TaxID=614101 RepID=A0ABQ9GB57_9NEOP|nr:hypothetical protein PR048_030202 [Dryococelus australis]